MTRRRAVLYVVAVAAAGAVILGLLDRSGLAIAALAVAAVAMFGWIVLWAQALNARVSRIAADVERPRTGTERGAAGASLPAELDSTRQYVARRADTHDEAIARLRREVYAVQVSVQRTPSNVAELSRLYARLVRHDRPMPELGGWSMTSATLVWIIDQISSGRVSTILECGSGSSTVWFALALEQRGTNGQVISLESSAAYAEQTRARLAELGLAHRAQVLTAPLVDLELPDRATQPWFDLSVLPADVGNVDLLFVDGPVGNTSPLARYPALPALADRLTDNALVLLDDSGRSAERKIVKLWTATPYGGRRYEVTHELDRATVLRRIPPPGDTMLWADRSRGKPFSKDPSVVRFGDRYLMYFSVPPKQGDSRWGQAVAASEDLSTWTTIGEIEPAGEAEGQGICAGGAIVLGDRVHLFYQSYGRGADDAICHATSTDGVTFERSSENPIVRASGDWNSGRAIDAEVHVIGDELFCYWATRDPSHTVQLLGVHSAPLSSDLSAKHWRQRCSESILRPELPWEKNCIEAPSICRRGDTYVMFYAGGYNNEPQQIGVAFSPDGLVWERMSDEPFLTNGEAGEWNSSESGHPAIFVDPVDGVTWLFYQGNNDGGKSWYLSRRRIEWDGHVPRLA